MKSVDQRVGLGEPLASRLFRHRIQWQRKVVTGLDDFGQDECDWRQIITCACKVEKVEGLRGKEIEADMQKWAEADFRISQHDTRGMLQTADRGQWYVHGTHRYLDIVGISDPVGTGNQQVIYAKEWKG